MWYKVVNFNIIRYGKGNAMMQGKVLYIVLQNAYRSMWGKMIQRFF